MYFIILGGDVTVHFNNRRTSNAESFFGVTFAVRIRNSGLWRWAFGIQYRYAVIFYPSAVRNSGTWEGPRAKNPTLYIYPPLAHPPTHPPMEGEGSLLKTSHPQNELMHPSVYRLSRQKSFNGKKFVNIREQRDATTLMAIVTTMKNITFLYCYMCACIFQFT